MLEFIPRPFDDFISIPYKIYTKGDYNNQKYKETLFKTTMRTALVAGVLFASAKIGASLPIASLYTFAASPPAAVMLLGVSALYYGATQLASSVALLSLKQLVLGACAGALGWALLESHDRVFAYCDRNCKPVNWGILEWSMDHFLKPSVRI